MANVAQQCRMDKEARPELYCRNPKCLWKIVTRRGPNPCRNHPVATSANGEG